MLRLTQQEAAARLNVQPSALSNWERDTRAISIDLDLLDEALDGGKFLAGLLWSFGAASGLEPGRVWTRVFPGDSGPVWMWVRSEADVVRLEAEWGVAALQTDLALGPNGAFITVAASMPDSPVVAQLSEPGWAAFGRGTPPDGVPGAAVVPAVSLLRPSSADGHFMEMMKSTWSKKLQARSPDVANLGPLLGRVEDFVADESFEDDARNAPWHNGYEGLAAMERARFARLRKARRLSYERLAELVAERAGVEVSRDTLRRFERDIGRPHHPMLPTALDYVLDADGRLVLVGVGSGSGSASIRLPPYWRGPVWLDLATSVGPVTITLRRGAWHRHYRLASHSLVGLHWFDPEQSLRIEAEPTVTWQVGVGRRNAVEPIDQNWSPSDPETARRAVGETDRAIMAAALAELGDDTQADPPDATL